MGGGSGGSVPVLAEGSILQAGRRERWADLAPRAASAVVLAPLALACCWHGGGAWSALVAAAAVVLALEWRGMCRAGRLGLAAFAAGLAYIGVALASLMWLRAAPGAGLRTVVFLLLIVWATDVGAYLVGRWVGGALLAPAISPGKTWSGAAGGLVAAVLMGLALSWRWSHGAIGAVVVLSAVLSVASQLGDLLESAAKRRCGVKDSGRLIPGHGGLLDRVDGILCAAPAMAVLGLWLGRGIVLWN
jgi:phosphatidate cytidylyltransferase